MRSKYFYTEVLGFEIIAENYRENRNSYKLDLKVDENTAIELFSFPDAPPRNSYPEASEALALSEGLTNGISGTEEIGSRIILISEEK